MKKLVKGQEFRKKQITEWVKAIERSGVTVDRPGILNQVLIDQSIDTQEVPEIEVKDDVKTKGSSKNLDTYGDSPTVVF